MSAAHRMSPGRRRFVKLLGWASVIAAAPGPTLAAAARARSEAATPRPAPAPAAPPPEKTEVSEDARALAGVLHRRHGQHWSAEQLRSVTADLDADRQAAERLREVKLGNGEEPDFTFKA